MPEPPIESDELDEYDPAVLTKAQRKAIISGQLTGQEQAEVEERAREFETRFEGLIVDLALLEYSNVHPQHIYLGSAIDTDLPLDTLLGDTHLMSDGFHTDFGALLGHMYEVILLPRDLYPADVVYGLLVGICGKELDEHDTGGMESILEDVEAELMKRWALTDYHRPFDYSHRDSIDINKVITEAGFEENYDSLNWILQVLVNSGAKREINYDSNAHQTDSYPNLGGNRSERIQESYEMAKR